MQERKYKVSKKVWFYSWWKWVSLALFILLVLCLLLKCCNERGTPIGGSEGDTPVLYDNGQSVENGIPKHNVWINRRNGLPDFNPDNIGFIPNDPLRRKGVNNLLNVYLKDTTDIIGFVERVQSAFESDSVSVNYYAEEYKRVQFRIDENRIESLRVLLKENFDEVKFVVSEWILEGYASVHNDPGFRETELKWFYETIGLFEAWEQTLGDSNITVAVIDGGFEPNHAELEGRIRNQWNVFNYSAEISADGNGLEASHGTHVAGTVAGNIDNGIGISGVAPKCRIMPIQISDKSGIISISSILDGVFYALKNDADVINISLALSLQGVSNQLSEEEQRRLSSTLLLEEAAMWDEVYAIAREENTIIVQAAGNDAVLASLDPMKRSQNTIVVGASDISNRPALFSNKGESVTIYAPGVQIYSSVVNGDIAPMDGTSMASPIVAGCVALVKSVNKDIDYATLVNLMRSTSYVSETEIQIIQVDELLKKAS
jgi:subtilisin family serine protease